MLATVKHVFSGPIKSVPDFVPKNVYWGYFQKMFKERSQQFLTIFLLQSILGAKNDWEKVLNLFILLLQMHRNSLPWVPLVPGGFVRKCFVVFIACTNCKRKHCSNTFIQFIISYPKLLSKPHMHLQSWYCSSINRFSMVYSQRLLHLLYVLHGDVVDVTEVDPVPPCTPCRSCRTGIHQHTW